MEYREIRPSGAVRRYIRCYWFLEDDSPLLSVQRIVPDGRSELVLNLGQPFESQRQGHWSRQPQSFLVGQITGPMLIRPGGPTRTFGVRFHPHGAAQLLKLPIHEVTDSVVPLEDISQQLRRHFEPIVEPRSVPEQFAALDQAMRTLAAQTVAEDSLVIRAVEQFEHSGGKARISHLAERSGVSTRQLERRFRDAVGISPKLFCRMQRFQRIFSRMEAPESDWADAAVHCGYYDQGHLIRDFRQFSGKTPTALLSEEIDLARYFAQSGPMSHLSNTAARSGS